MASLFQRLSRYRATADLHPRENQLTEAFASVLERVAGLAAHLFGDALDSSSGKLDVRTQVPTASGGFIDLELARREPSTAMPDGLVWVEVKHRAPLSDNQLERYLDDIRGKARRANVVFLAPRATVRSSRLPQADELLAMEWEAVARALQDWMDGAGSAPPRDCWLVEEFQTYLHEEGLMDPGKLDAIHVEVLRSEPAASRSVGALWDVAKGHVIEHWGEAIKQGAYASFGHWSTWNTGGDDPDARWGTAVLQASSLADEGVRMESAGGWVFGAGVTFISSNRPTGTGNEGWLAHLADNGFEIDGFCGYPGEWCIWRFKDPADLISGASLEDQGTSLGEWIVETFEVLKRSGPLRDRVPGHP